MGMKMQASVRQPRRPLGGKVALTAVQCRHTLCECIAMAERAGRENAASLTKMAETWLQLAEQLDPRAASNWQRSKRAIS